MPRKVLAFFIIAIYIWTFNLSALVEARHGPIFVFSGRGYGHGIGLSQYGAKGFAENNYDHNAILAHYYQSTNLERRAAKTLRILVASKRRDVFFTGRKNFTVYSESKRKKYAFLARHKYRISIRGSRYLIQDMSTRKNVGLFEGQLRVLRGGGIKLLSSDDNSIKGNVYRGWLRIVRHKNRIYVVNYVNSEHYLFSVVPREMPRSWPMEALKSQAIAARTYAYNALIKRKSFFDMYATVKSQVYTGFGAEHPRPIKAVKETAGAVVTYQGKAINAFFHSGSGGATENNENVWKGKPIPWLRAVRSPYEGKAADWPARKKFSRPYIERKIGRYSKHRKHGVKGSLRTLKVIKRGVSPRVLVVKVVGTKGVSYITGGKLRKLLRLRSSWFFVKRK